MNQRTPLLYLLLLLTWSAALSAQRSPNIIFILSDDLGYGDLGKFNTADRPAERRFDTPYLDRLAEGGMMLTDHYVSGPVCAPSRASFLLGLHQGHAQVRNNQFDKELPDGLNVASLLSGAGYRTVHVGKYGLAGSKGSKHEAHPLRRGFTDFFGYLHHVDGHEHYPRNGTTDKQAFVVDGYEPITEGTEKTYTTDLFTARAKAYLMEQQRDNPEQPLFLYLAYDTPHMKMQVPTGPYPAGSGLDGGVQYTGADHPETPYVNTARGTIDSYLHPDYRDREWPELEKVFATMVRRLDTSVGDLLQLLVDLGIEEETIVIFSSDNGPHSAHQQDPTWFRSYGPFTGIKRDMYEGGIRVPTVASWPGKIPSATVSSVPVGNWDWLATFADLAGVPVPAYTDGESLLPLLDGSRDSLDRQYLYWEYFHRGKVPGYGDFSATARDRRRGEMQAVRIGQYKGIRFNVTGADDPFEIYDLAADTTEAGNLAGSMPDLERRMRKISSRARIPDTSARRPYDESMIAATEEAGSLVTGAIRRPFRQTGLWLPAHPDYTTPGSAVGDGPAVDVAAGLESGTSYEWSTYLVVPEDGAYTFELKSNGPAYLRLHDIHLLRNEVPLADSSRTATLQLEAGPHPLTVLYAATDTAEPALRLRWRVPGADFADIPPSAFRYDRRDSR